MIDSQEIIKEVKQLKVKVIEADVWIECDKWHHIVIVDGKLYIDGKEL